MMNLKNFQLKVIKLLHLIYNQKIDWTNDAEDKDSHQWDDNWDDDDVSDDFSKQLRAELEKQNTHMKS